MKNYRKEIRQKAAMANQSLKGYKVIDMENGDKVVGKIVTPGAAPNVFEVMTGLGLKELDLSKYQYSIDPDLKIVELNQRYKD